MLKSSRLEQLSGKWGFKNCKKTYTMGLHFYLKSYRCSENTFVCCQNEKDFYAVQKLIMCTYIKKIRIRYIIMKHKFFEQIKMRYCGIV